MGQSHFFWIIVPVKPAYEQVPRLVIGDFVECRGHLIVHLSLRMLSCLLVFDVDLSTQLRC
jgi:hypothetical protein